MRILSFCSKLKPRSLTKFLCWSFANNITSFLNSCSPCPELSDSLFTATFRPSSSWPWWYLEQRRMMENTKVYFLVFVGSHQTGGFNFINSIVLYFFFPFIEILEIFRGQIMNYLINRTKSPSSKQVGVWEVVCCNSYSIKVKLQCFPMGLVICSITKNQLSYSKWIGEESIKAT